MFERYVLKQINEAKSREEVFTILENASAHVNESGEDSRIIKRLGIAGYKKIAEISADRQQLDEFDAHHILHFSEGIYAREALTPSDFYKAVAAKAEADLQAELVAEAARKAAASNTGFFSKALKFAAGATLAGAALSIGYRVSNNCGQ